MKKSESGAIGSAVIASSLDCVIIIDEEGRIEEFNPAAERTFGYSRIDVIGAQIAEMIVPAHMRERHRRGLARYTAGGEPVYVGRRVETEALCADGSTIPVELTITEVSGAKRLFAASLRTLFERDKRQELEETRRELEFAVDAAKLGTWTFDPATGRLSYSDYGKQLYGFAP